jgi:hypothetical protein
MTMTTLLAMASSEQHSTFDWFKVETTKDRHQLATSGEALF